VPHEQRHVEETQQDIHAEHGDRRLTEAPLVLEHAEDTPYEAELERRIERDHQLGVRDELQVARRDHREDEIHDEDRDEEAPRRWKILRAAAVERDFDERENQSQHRAGSAGKDRDNSAAGGRRS
jgi:hypothetical protein